MSLLTKIDGRPDVSTLSVRWAHEPDGPSERRRRPRDHLCFGVSGSSLIASGRGLIRATEVKIGDVVMNGQGGSNRVAAVLVALTVPGRDRIRIAQGALGDGLPVSDMVVGPRQRIKVTAQDMIALANHEDATVAAEDLLPLPGVETVIGKLSEVVHIVIDAYDFFLADGLVVQGLSPTRSVLETLPVDLAEDLCDAMPKLRYSTADASYLPAIPALDAREARYILSRSASFAPTVDHVNWSDTIRDQHRKVAKDGRGPVPTLSLAAKNV